VGRKERTRKKPNPEISDNTGINPVCPTLPRRTEIYAFSLSHPLIGTPERRFTPDAETHFRGGSRGYW
jgi:hypothetical protein